VILTSPALFINKPIRTNYNVPYTEWKLRR